MPHPLIFFKHRALARSLAASLLRWRARCSDSRIGLVVCYHKVGDPGGNPAVELVPSVGSRLLRRQLAHVRRGYHVVPLTRLMEAVALRHRGARFPVAITFDDDLASHAEVAVGELRGTGVPACFFLSGRSLSAPFSFWWEDLQRIADRGIGVELHAAGLRFGGSNDIYETAARIESLTPVLRDAVADELHSVAGPWPPTAGIRTDAIRRIAQSGFEIGFHTRGHYLLTTLNDERLERELRDGRAELEALLGQQISLFAYPHGKADGRVALAARRAGFAAAFTTDPTPVAVDADPYLLGRIDVSPVSRGHFAFAIARALGRQYRREAA